MTDNSFGKILQAHRKDKQLSQQELADALNAYSNNSFHVSKSMISRWEKGKTDPQMQYVRLVTSFFQISPSSIVSAENDDILTVYNKLNHERRARVYSFANNQLAEQVHEQSSTENTELLAAHLDDDKMTDDERQQVNDFLRKIRNDKTE